MMPEPVTREQVTYVCDRLVECLGAAERLGPQR